LVRGDPAPDGGVLAQQIVEAFPWDAAPTYLMRDNDGAYGHAFTNRIRAMGIRDRPISPRSPWQNSYVERLIGTLRRECLDHVLIFGERHLHRVLASYSFYYNESRTHLGLGKDAPLRRAVERSGTIITTPILFGLHHRYARIWFSGRTGTAGAAAGQWNAEWQGRHLRRPTASHPLQGLQADQVDRRA
jgi:Integrase core domain